MSGRGGPAFALMKDTGLLAEPPTLPGGINNEILEEGTIQITVYLLVKIMYFKYQYNTVTNNKKIHSQLINIKNIRFDCETADDAILDAWREGGFGPPFTLAVELLDEEGCRAAVWGFLRTTPLLTLGLLA